MTLEAPAGARRRQKELAVTLNTRVSLSTRNLIDDIANRHGISIREVVENAVVEKWADKERGSGE